MNILHQTTTGEDVVVNFQPDLFNRLLRRRDRMLREAQEDREVIYHVYWEEARTVRLVLPSPVGPSLRELVLRDRQQRDKVRPIAPYIVLPDYPYDYKDGEAQEALERNMYVRKYDIFWVLSMGGGGRPYREWVTEPFSWDVIATYEAYVARGVPLPNGGAIE